MNDGIFLIFNWAQARVSLEESRKIFFPHLFSFGKRRPLKEAIA